MIIFIHGEDTFRSKQYLKGLKNKFLRDVDVSGSNLNIVNGVDCSLGEIVKTFGAMSLFARKRMVVIENIFKNSNAAIFGTLLEFLKKEEGAEDNILIFWNEALDGKASKDKKELAKFLTEQKYSPKEFVKLTLAESAQWIQKEITLRGGGITLRAINLLNSITENDLWRVNNEIEKLVAWKGGGVIDDGDVRMFVEAKSIDNIFALADAFAQGARISLDLLNEQIESGSDEFFVLTMLSRHFRILAQIKSASENGLTQGQIVSEFKIHPFVVKKSLEQARKFDVNKIKFINHELAMIDGRAKNGLTKVKAGLELLAIKIG